MDGFLARRLAPAPSARPIAARRPGFIGWKTSDRIFGVIRLRIPSRLEYRDLAVRTVASACKLVRDSGDDFHNEVISAFSEALNNVVVHACGAKGGDLDIEIDPGDDRITIQLMDYGRSFDPASVPAPDLDSLPESGFGLFIMRSFMDQVTYASGAPNRLSMTKFSKPRRREP